MRKWITAITLLFLLVFTIPTAIAEDSLPLLGEKQLTLEQAYDLAAKNSRSLRQAELAVNRAQEVKSFRMESVDYIPSGPTPTVAANTWTAAVMADIGWQMAVKNKSVEEDKLYLSVVEKYNNLLAAQENLTYSQKSFSQSQAQNRVNELSLALGLTSNMQYNIGHYSFKTSKVELENAQTALNKAYTEFNNLLGLSLSERPILLDQPLFEAAEVDNLESTIHRTLDGDPTVWMKEQAADLERLQLDLYNYMDPTRDPYKAEQIDIDKAELSAQDTRSQMKQMMRTLYNSMQQLEETHKIKQQVANIAEQNLKLKKAMFEVGMTSQMDLNQAELEATKAQLDLNQITYQYQNLKLSFEKPWAYAANLYK